MLDYIKKHWFILVLILVIWGVTISITNDKPIFKKNKIDSSSVKTDSLILAFDSVNDLKEKYQLKKIDDLKKEKKLVENQKEKERKQKEQIKLEKEMVKQDREREIKEKEYERRQKQELEMRLEKECSKVKKLEDFLKTNYSVGDTFREFKY